MDRVENQMDQLQWFLNMSQPMARIVIGTKENKQRKRGIKSKLLGKIILGMLITMTLAYLDTL